MRNNNKEPRRRYKLFIIVFITHVLGGALEASLPSNTLSTRFGIVPNLQSHLDY